jgi:hypothetical protein
MGPSQRPLPENTQHSKETDIHDPAGLEPATPGSQWLQTHALHRVATEEYFRKENSKVACI